MATAAAAAAAAVAASKLSAHNSNRDKLVRKCRRSKKHADSVFIVGDDGLLHGTDRTHATGKDPSLHGTEL